MAILLAMANKQGPGGAARKGRSASGRAVSAAPSASSRYTPPIPRSNKVSPKWMGPLILLLLIAGALMIVLNYFNVMPAGPSNWYLVGGIILIASGFVVATQYH